MRAEVSLKENAVYRVIDGELKEVSKPKLGFGKQIITWHDGKPLNK